MADHSAIAPAWHRSTGEADLARMQLLAWAFAALVVVCSPPAPAADPGAYAGRRVLHIDSYHAGNEWNDRIDAAIAAAFAGTGVDLKVVFLDSKRHASEAEIEVAALRIKEEIERFAPDVVTASDDPAAKYVIAPYYKDAALPFVFCGLNWDAAAYGLPFTNATGMIEVSPIPQIIRLLRPYAHGPRLGFLAEDTETKRKELEYHRKVFGIAYDKVYFADTFAQWVEAFERAQDEVDMLLILGVGAIHDWDARAARELAAGGSRIPAGTDFSWLMNVSLLGVAKVPEEQGRWAAEAAMAILDGVSPSRIPMTYNREGRLYFNPTIAARLGVTNPPPLAQLVP
ncbi:MAG: ABC transporter substrate-binding protein [Rhodospirillales bacterium]|nr:ABC transporter substrate-binding protein [Rhodospirillales bacterium]